MNIVIDNAIFTMQQQGGISRLWRSLLPALCDALPDATFDPAQPADWWISTYYQRAPIGVKSLAVVYDLIVDKYPLITNRADSADIRRAVNDASAVVSISQSTAADVKTRLNRDSVIAYPGVDEHFGKVMPSAVARFQQFIGKPYVLVVGRRGLYKNIQTLYQSWKVWPAHKDYKLLCIGGEEPLPQDIAFAKAFPDTWQRMTLNDADLAAAYAGALCLVYPSIMEGFGLPLVEAMACACPIICDSTMGEIVADSAWTCDVTKPRAIASGLELMGNPSNRVLAAIRGAERAKRYRWSSMAIGIAEALKSA